MTVHPVFCLDAQDHLRVSMCILNTTAGANFVRPLDFRPNIGGLAACVAVQSPRSSLYTTRCISMVDQAILSSVLDGSSTFKLLAISQSL
jgi:hypothetical protein